LPDRVLKRILVAEDDIGIRRVITMTLEKVGLEVIQAGDGAEAYEKAVALLPDAMLLDIGLPTMDGLTLCKKLRTVASTAQIPIGFLTAQVEPETYREAAKAGSALFVPKPFDPERLSHLVQILLSQSK